MSGLSLFLLGQFQGNLDDRPMPRLPTLRAQGLLIYLATEAALGTARQRREALVELLWPGMPAGSALKNLRTTLYYLRRELDGDLPLLLTDRQTAQLNPDYRLKLDVAEFLHLLDGPQEGWPDAVALYRGDFLLDFTIPESNPFEEWAVARRTAFRRQQLGALDALAGSALAAGRFQEVERLARRQLELDGGRESAWRQLMESMARDGRRSEALEAYEAGLELLWKEFGLEPGPEMARLFEAIQSGAVDSSRVAEISHPVAPPEPAGHNLPAQIAPCIGRESELGVLAEHLQDPAGRLITIVGPGGMGKTTLALAGARLALASDQVKAHFSDGLYFVPLAAVEHSEHLLTSLCDALGFQIQDRGQDSAGQQLMNFLRHKRILLILDNFEQLLLDGAGTGLIAQILAAAPDVRIVVTSRSRLDMRGERLLPLSGLAFGDRPPADLDDSPAQAVGPAAELFLEAAQRIRPDLELSQSDQAHLARICRQVEGMPLALELAAAWVDTLTLDEIAAELGANSALLESVSGAGPERQHSLDAIWNSAWHMLSPQEQSVFSRLCLAPGGFTRQAAAAFAGATLPILAGLTSRYLLTLLRGSGGSRGSGYVRSGYHIHALLRRFGLERLDDSGEMPAARQEFFDYYRALAAWASSRLRTPDQVDSLAQLDAERDNLRAALRWGLAQPKLVEASAALAIDLSWYWRMRSRTLEGREWMEQTLALPDLEPSTRASLLFHGGHLAWMTGDFELAGERQQDSLALWRTLGEAGGLGAAYAQQALGMVRYELGELDRARSLFERSLVEFRALADVWGEAFTLGWLSFTAQRLEEWETARKSAELSTRLFRQLGDRWALSLFVGSLAWIALHEGQLAEARAMGEETYSLRMAFGHTHSAGDSLILLGQAALQEGDQARAEAHFRQALKLFTEIGNAPYAAVAQAMLDELD